MDELKIERINTTRSFQRNKQLLCIVCGVRIYNVVNLRSIFVGFETLTTIIALGIYKLIPIHFRVYGTILAAHLGSCPTCASWSDGGNWRSRNSWIGERRFLGAFCCSSTTPRFADLLVVSLSARVLPSHFLDDLHLGIDRV